MSHPEECNQETNSAISRRKLVTALAVGAGAIALTPRVASAADAAGPMAPPSTVTTPPRDFGPNGAPTTYFTDPDVLTFDPSFPASPTLRSSDCGPVLSGVRDRHESTQGRYFVWSDIPNNRQMRWIEDDGHVSVFPGIPRTDGDGNTSTSRAGRSAASILPGASPATNSTVPRP